jgi:hypothetical protein
MADLDDALDIELQDVDDVGGRILILAALSVWPEIDDFRERQAWRGWLEDQGLTALATDDEMRLLGSDRLGKEEADVCERALDAIVPLAWSTGLSDDVSITTSLDLAALADLLPMPPERIEPFLDQLVMRDEDEIALERERAEIWNWRLAAESIRRKARGLALQEIEEAIGEVVLEAAISFALDEADTEDFLVDGVPVSRLDSDRLDSLTVTSEERLRAFNWLCGLTEWDAVHVPD